MRKICYLLLLLSFPLSAQVQNWDPEPYNGDGGIRFNDDLDFYLNSYTKDEIKEMRHQVSIWRMNFDKMIRATVQDGMLVFKVPVVPKKSGPIPINGVFRFAFVGEHDGKTQLDIKSAPLMATVTGKE